MHGRRTSTYPALAGLAVLALLAGGGNCDCDCDGSTPQPQCASAADCVGRPLPDGGCPGGSGTWACVDGYCVLECFPCAEAADCDAYAWPDGAGCDEEDGYWECVDGACAPRCPAGPCEEDADCEGLPWPTHEERPDLDCSEATGHWECNDGVCAPFCNEECNATVDCTVFPWTADCEGHFDCVRGRCEEVCGDGVCGDSECRAELGETEESCPTDCREPCEVDEDCLDRHWDVPCDGTWDCGVGGGCFPTCDYATCGDGACDAALGERYDTCRADCEGCGGAEDCVGLKPWPLLCQGRWTCVGARCNAQCTTVTCGDGVCRPFYGEDGSSCAADCGYGPCREAVDCLGAPWTAACQARWSCDAAGGCRPDCEAGGCGDGACDLLGGESPTSCAADCAAFGCLTTPGCVGHALPAGCDGGEWMCVAEVCRPVCP